jgi:hypothetical protein
VEAKRSGRLLHLTASQKFGATWRKGKSESEWAEGAERLRSKYSGRVFLRSQCRQQSMIDGSKMSNNVIRV